MENKMIDFNDFDLEDAALFGATAGFVEDSLKEEEACQRKAQEESEEFFWDEEDDESDQI